MSGAVLDYLALQNYDLARRPVCVVGAVSDAVVRIVPSDHDGAAETIEGAFEGAVFIRDAAVNLNDEVLIAARRKARHEIVFEACGEALKSLENALALAQVLADKSSGSVVVMGSGCLINLVTYAVAAQDYAVELTVVPTNAMAIADVAYGGLGLVNDISKNDVRKFKDPTLIVLSRAIFSAAPMAQQMDGQIEVVKHLLFQEMGRNSAKIAEILCPNGAQTSGMLFDNAVLGLKLNILLRSAIGAGQVDARGILNFGHGHAHALERQSGYRLKHSEAVRFGMALDCAFTDPDLAALLCQNAAWSSLLVEVGNALMSSDGLLNLALYESKYMRGTAFRQLIPRVTQFPYAVELLPVSQGAVSAKMKEMLL